ncbi:MAG: GntR family transcriptional regulator [Alphaproteobacteria bacterium]
MEPKRADIIANEIESLIFSGEYGDGDRLDEHDLAERFGVSRTPIRESLQRLAFSGLVEQIPRRGVFVRQPTPVELMEMFEVMGELEASCGRLAAKRISDSAIEELRTANHRCRDAMEAADTDRYYAENEVFHTTIYRESGNSFLDGETRRLHRRLRPFRRMQLRLRGRMAESLREHEAATDALAAGDADMAANVLRGHVSIQGEKFYHLIAKLK